MFPVVSITSLRPALRARYVYGAGQENLEKINEKNQFRFVDTFVFRVSINIFVDISISVSVTVR